MPPKKVEKKEILPVFEPLEERGWWEFTEYSEEDIQKVDGFFQTYQLELKDIINQNVKESIRFILQKMGAIVHPQFTEEQQEAEEQEQSQSQQEEQKQDQLESSQQQQQQQDEQQQDQVSQQQGNESMKNYLVMQNGRYDYATFQSLLYYYQNMPELNVIKFANNYFSEQTVKVLFDYVCNQETTKVQKFFFDWNPLEAELANSLYQNLGMSNIEFMILRSNNLQGNQVKVLCESIKSNPNCQIKHLELYDNNIGAEGCQAIGDLLTEYMKLEYLSIAQNKLSSIEDMQPILENIGYSVLDEEGLAKYQEQEKEREDLLALKAKKKKIDENRLAELQKLLPLKEIGEEGSGQFAFVRNPQLKILNMAMNPLTNKDVQGTEAFIKNLPEDFSLILVHSMFEQKTKDKIRQKYKKNVLI